MKLHLKAFLAETSPRDPILEFFKSREDFKVVEDSFSVADEDGHHMMDGFYWCIQLKGDKPGNSSITYYPPEQLQIGTPRITLEVNKGLLITEMYSLADKLGSEIFEGNYGKLPEFADLFIEIINREELAHSYKKPIAKVASTNMEKIYEFFFADNRFFTTDNIARGKYFGHKPNKEVYEETSPLNNQMGNSFGLIMMFSPEEDLIFHCPVKSPGILQSQLGTYIRNLIDEIKRGDLSKLPDLADAVYGYWVKR